MNYRVEKFSAPCITAGSHGRQGIHGLRRGGESPRPDALLAARGLVGQQERIRRPATTHDARTLHHLVGDVQRCRGAAR